MQVKTQLVALHCTFRIKQPEYFCLPSSLLCQEAASCYSPIYHTTLHYKAFLALLSAEDAQRLM